MKSKSFLIIVLFFMMFAVAGCSMLKRQLNDNGHFKLIIWDYSVEDIKDIETLTYGQLISEHMPLGILSDKYIARYYWDEQFIEYEYDNIKGFVLSDGFFSMVLDNKIILHGMSDDPGLRRFVSYFFQQLGGKASSFVRATPNFEHPHFKKIPLFNQPQHNIAF